MAKKSAKTSPDLRRRIFEAALPDVAFDGWTDEVLDRATKKLKLDVDAVDEAFPKGPLSLAEYFAEWADDRMAEKLDAKKLAGMRIRDRVAHCVRTRLEILAPHRQALSSALAFLAMPPRNLVLPKMVWRTADAIWRACGDTSTDYNHYTKRLLLSGVLTSTALYWLNDKSDGSGKTWAFLGSRIDDVMKIGGAIGKLKSGAEKAKEKVKKAGTRSGK